MSDLQGTTQYYLKQIGYKDLREDDYINKLYYILRHINYHRYGGNMPSEYFAYTFRWGLDLRSIPSELVVTSASFVTKPSDIIFKGETEWIVKVKDKYVFAPTIFSNPFDFRDDFQNVEAYIISLGKTPSAKPITLPTLKADENLTVNTITASLDTSFTVMNVTRQEAFRGRNKVPANVDGLIYTTAMDDDYKSYGGEDDIRAQLKGPMLESYEDKLRERKKEDKQRKIDYMKNSLLEDFNNVIAYHDFTLNSDGRTLRKQDLVYTSRFDLGDMVRKAGKNLLVSVPGLIGDQLFIMQKERNREYNANMGYARTFINEITFNIPAGYTVVGLQSLNSTVDNEVGSFTTIAKVEGNQLKISAKKVYKQMIVKKEDWKKMLAFLDAAFNYSQKKILLKKQ